MSGYENKLSGFDKSILSKIEWLNFESFSAYYEGSFQCQTLIYYVIRYTNIFNNKTHLKRGDYQARNIFLYRQLSSRL